MRGGPTCQGLAHAVARKMFELVQTKSANGTVFVIEASYLEIHAGDGDREQLIDLLAKGAPANGRRLEVKQDPLNLKSFVCENLSKVPVTSADDLTRVIGEGRQQCASLEGAQHIHASRAHCLLVLTVESLGVNAGGGDTMVQRGKLILADLAGCESAPRPQPAGDEDEERRLRQAAMIDRGLTSLGTVASGMGSGPPGQRDPAVALLLRDCISGGARVMLLACLSLEAEGADDTVRTLAFVQPLQGARSLASMRGIDKEHSTLHEMRQRHMDAIRALQETVSSDTQAKQQEVQHLKGRLEGLEEKAPVQEVQKIDEIRREMAQTMSKELEQLRLQSVQDFKDLRASIERQVEEARCQQQVEESKAAVDRMQAELTESQRAQRAMEEEVSALKVQLASSEERARLLQERQEEVRGERMAIEEERRSLRQQAEEQWQKLTEAEKELGRLRAEHEALKSENGRLSSSRSEDTETLEKERADWKEREASLQRSAAQMRTALEDAKRQAEVDALNVASQHREAVGELRAQVEQLEAEIASGAQKLRQANDLRDKAEAEHAAILAEERQALQQSMRELFECQQELEEAKGRERELMHMLNEVQDSIITVSDGGMDFHSDNEGSELTPPRQPI